MKSKTPLITYLSLSSMLLMGCTTVETFRQMSQEQRANKVCTKRLNNQISEVQTLEEKIIDSQNALSKGYRVHRQCQKVAVYGDASTTCSTVGTFTNCQQFRPTSYETRCSETPVSINPELERSNIQEWSNAITSIRQSGNEAWRSCYNAVYKMSAEEAFRWYPR